MVTGFSAPYWIEDETIDGTTITTSHRGLWQVLHFSWSKGRSRVQLVWCQLSTMSSNPVICSNVRVFQLVKSKEFLILRHPNFFYVVPPKVFIGISQNVLGNPVKWPRDVGLITRWALENVTLDPLRHYNTVSWLLYFISTALHGGRECSQDLRCHAKHLRGRWVDV